MKKLIALAICAVIASGCASDRPDANGVDRHHRLVKIETDPPGMRVYFGYGATTNLALKEREYVGTSPCTYLAKSTAKGYFVNTVSQFAQPVAVFYAEPPALATNLYPQRQEFKAPAFVVRPAPIPQAVFFDMHKAQ